MRLFKNSCYCFYPAQMHGAYVISALCYEVLQKGCFMNLFLRIPFEHGFCSSRNELSKHIMCNNKALYLIDAGVISLGHL